MRVLAHIHAFNDADIIDRTIASVRAQTRRVDEILLVDNGSRDDTLAQPLVEQTTVLRHPENLGTSGAVHSGIQYALDRGYDWVWLFDADSNPAPDALERLLGLLDTLPEGERQRIGFLGCVHYNVDDNIARYGAVFTKNGFGAVEPAVGPFTPCHANIWSGCLYNLAAVRTIGLPNLDYVLDWGENEYGYRLSQAGYRNLICHDAVLHHNIRGRTSLRAVMVRFAGMMFVFIEFPAIRCYYTVRNTFYFALYEAKEGRLRLLADQGWDMLRLTLKFLMRPKNHGAQIRACLRGLWHGVTGNIAARY